VENSRRALGVLSGRDVFRDQIIRWAKQAEIILAADAGADTLTEANVKWDLLIGDLDSVSERALASSSSTLEIKDQDSTDCDKLLTYAEQNGISAITLIGVEGDLPDHVLATYQSAAKSSIDVRFVFRRGIGWIVRPGLPRHLQTIADRRLSLVPLAPCVGVNLSGCEWPLSNAELSPLGSTSISNRTESDSVSVTMEKGAALLFLEVPASEMPVW